MRNLIIGGIEIPLKAAHQLTQEYAPVRAVNRLRMSDGTLVQQSAWSGKLVTNISGAGNMPDGLESLDYLSAIIIKCVAERAVLSASNSMSIPSARRVDYGVEGKALVAGTWVTTAVSMTGDTATLTVIATATQYQAIYWPELTCFINPPNSSRNARNSTYQWNIEAEEI